MSDAYTDLARDSNIDEKSSLIEKLKKNFISQPCHETAEKIIFELRELLGMSRGYFRSIDKYNIRATIKNYQTYLEDEYTVLDF